jgi:hypothetical protein
MRRRTVGSVFMTGIRRAPPGRHQPYGCDEVMLGPVVVGCAVSKPGATQQASQPTVLFRLYAWRDGRQRCRFAGTHEDSCMSSCRRRAQSRMDPRRQAASFRTAPSLTNRRPIRDPSVRISVELA